MINMPEPMETVEERKESKSEDGRSTPQREKSGSTQRSSTPTRRDSNLSKKSLPERRDSDSSKGSPSTERKNSAISKTSSSLSRKDSGISRKSTPDRIAAIRRDSDLSSGKKSPSNNGESSSRHGSAESSPKRKHSGRSNGSDDTPHGKQDKDDNGHLSDHEQNGNGLLHVNGEDLNGDSHSLVDFKSERDTKLERYNDESRASSRSSTASPGVPHERTKVNLIYPMESKYACPACQDLLRYPIKLDDCGHRVCSACFYDIQRVEPRCPIDQNRIQRHKCKLDMEFNKEIQALDVKCNCHEWGCKWEGPLQDVQTHNDVCDYADALCINDCGVKFQRRFLQKHLEKDCPKKIIPCPFCDERHLREDKKAHLEDCINVPLPCPNKCDKKLQIPKNLLDKHIEEECPRTKVMCQYEEIGCSHRSSREKLLKHYKSGIIDHVAFIYNFMMEQTRRIDHHDNQLQDHLNVLENHQSRLGDLERLSRNQLIWRIDDYSRKVKEAKSGNAPTLFSPPFTTSKHGYRLCASICLNGDGKGKGSHISVFVSILRGAFDSLLKWPFDYRVTFFLLDQNDNVNERKHIKFSIKPNPCAENEPFLGKPRLEKNASFGGAKFAKQEDVEKRDYIKGDTIFIKVVVDCDGSTEP